MKEEFNDIISQCNLSAMNLGLEHPWNETIGSMEYYFEIMKLLNVLIYAPYKALQQAIEMLPKGNVSGLVEMSFEMFESIRTMIENSYLLGSDYAQKNDVI